MQYKPRTQITHKSTKHQRTTFTGVITNTLNLSYSVTVTRQNKIPILTDDTYYNMTYSSIGRKAFHRALWMGVTTINEWRNIQWLFFNVCACFLSWEPSWDIPVLFKEKETDISPKTLARHVTEFTKIFPITAWHSCVTSQKSDCVEGYNTLPSIQMVPIYI